MRIALKENVPFDTLIDNYGFVREMDYGQIVYRKHIQGLNDWVLEIGLDREVVFIDCNDSEQGYLFDFTELYKLFRDDIVKWKKNKGGV